MAYEIEQRIYPDLIQQPDDVPYRTARKIVEYYNPSLLEIPNCLIALLDASLLYQNPADIFVRVLEELKQYDIGMLYDAKIYEIAEKVQPFTYNGNISAEQYLISQSIISGGQLATYFTSEIFGKTGYWISNLLGCAIDLRQKVRHFPCTIASGGKIQGNEVFRYIFDLLGTPLMSNNLGDNFFYSRLQEKISNINPQNLWAINQVYNIYINSEKSQMCRCQLKQWCSKTCLDNHQVDYTDNRCFDNPWERVNDEELCQFAQIWRTWGMEGFVPTERSQ
jgi:hypothetical protein